MTKRLLGDNPSRFFMPGHKGKLSFYDITEIDGADNLVKPTGEILKAQEKIAEIYGAKQSFISVNGSSGALMAAILTACADGRIIADRQCHISALNAMILGNIEPYWIYPEQDGYFGAGCGITQNQVETALKECPEAKAVLVTSPTYYGVCSDIKEICAAAHRHGAAVIVDAAHGAHFAFSDRLPECAVKSGADYVIHSTHKTLPCLTQGALLHCGGGADGTALKETLNMLQTTSPSYLIMSSVEQSVYEAVNYDYGALIERCDNIRKKSKLKTMCGGYFDYDRTRIVLNGENLDKLLCENGMIPEMYDGHNAVLLPSPCNDDRDFERLLKFVSECGARPAPYRGKLPRAKQIMMPAQAHKKKRELVSAENALGRICARAVYKNPPCMPAVCPGEEITADILPFIKEDIWCIKI